MTNVTLHEETIKQLVETSILSQKTTLALVKSVSDLSLRIDKLVTMFEKAAENVDKIKDVTREEIEDITKRLQEVIQQNKDLANGLLSLNNYTRSKLLQK
ncbi:hypothetical protein J4438_00295 [Candidatus Woesearchaeota archaeon]|nr:hypothetical protein [Candidatus Woesearchaeota archaeon]